MVDAWGHVERERNVPSSFPFATAGVFRFIRPSPENTLFFLFSSGTTGGTPGGDFSPDPEIPPFADLLAGRVRSLTGEERREEALLGREREIRLTGLREEILEEGSPGEDAERWGAEGEWLSLGVVIDVVEDDEAWGSCKASKDLVSSV
jgi:hypothetical protein